MNFAGKAASRFLRGAVVLSLALVLVVAQSGCNLISHSVGGGPGLARVNGSGNVITKDMDLRDFSEVEVSHAFTVDVVRADNFSVAVTSDDNLFEHIDVHVQGETLFIGLKNATFGNATWRARVTMPGLRRLETSGASRATVAGFKSGDSVRLEASGASKLTGRLDAGNLDLNLSGASSVELGGAAANLELEVSGASRAELGDLAVNDVRANLSGASSSLVNAKGRLDADVSGASTLSYVGSPTLGNTTTSGASSIKRR